tara:strand:- start:120 stop:1130 length:1011 start_codon:yes stop_codon:yes gene_type:complete
MRKLNILFRISGGKAPGKELGNGHIFRSMNLAYYFRGHNIWFLLEDFGGAEKILNQNGFKNIIKLKKNIDIDSDINRSIRIVKNKEIDVLINDAYLVNNQYLKKIKKFVKTVLVTDLKKYNYSADLIINGFIGFKNKKIITNNKKLILLGPKYQILNHQFSSKKKISKKNDLLVTFGGFDEKNITEIFLEEIIKFSTNMKIKIIHGPSSKKTKRIKEIEKNLPRNISFVSSANMFKEISNSKFGLCSGGITTYEFATLDVPFAILSQVKHQTITAKVWENIGMALNLGLKNKKTPAKIRNYLKSINSNLQINTKFSKHIDGFGGKRVSVEIMRIVE